MGLGLEVRFKRPCCSESLAEGHRFCARSGVAWLKPLRQRGPGCSFLQPEGLWPRPG